jgi:hypothetical protein
VNGKTHLIFKKREKLYNSYIKKKEKKEKRKGGQIYSPTEWIFSVFELSLYI